MSSLPVCPPLPGGHALCNCIVRTLDDGNEFCTQRSFLRTVSPFFDTAARMEHGSPCTISLRDVTSPVLQALVTFYYSDQLSLDDKNVVELLRAADMLLMSAARDKCFEWLTRRINGDNCFRTAAVAESYYCPKFREDVLNFIREHFAAIWGRSKEFPNAPPTLLKELLVSDALNAPKEADLLYAIHRWSSSLGSGEEAEATLLELLQCVRIGLCEDAALDHVRQRCPELAQSNAFKVAVSDAAQHGRCKCKGAMPKTQASGVDLRGIPKQGFGACSQCSGASPLRWLPRLPYELIVAVGGSSGFHSHSECTAYDSRAKRWITDKNEGLQRREYHGAAQLGSRIYVVGGRSTLGGQALRLVESFDTKRCVWERVAPMDTARSLVSVVALGGYIYAIGGNTGAAALKTVERFNPSQNQWSAVAPMKTARYAAGACVFKGKIYVSGGHTGKKILMSVEEYSPSLNRWSLSCYLPFPRYLHQMVSYAGRTYVIGGHDGTRACKTVFLSQKDLKQGWHDAAPMKEPHFGFAVAELEGELYVISGSMERGMSSNTVERYSSKTNSWDRAMGTNDILRGAAACTVKGLAAARYFASKDSMRNAPPPAEVGLPPAEVEAGSSDSSDEEEDIV